MDHELPVRLEVAGRNAAGEQRAGLLVLDGIDRRGAIEPLDQIGSDRTESGSARCAMPCSSSIAVCNGVAQRVEPMPCWAEIATLGPSISSRTSQLLKRRDAGLTGSIDLVERDDHRLVVGAKLLEHLR